jgi:hypothetical protein
MTASRSFGPCGARDGAMWDGKCTDFNVREISPCSSMMIIICANPETYEQPRLEPEKCGLFPARMGGLDGSLVTLFPTNQAQLQRRPLEAPTADVPARTTHA